MTAASDRLADDLMLYVYYDGREGSALTSEDRDTAGYSECQEQARALHALGWRNMPSREDLVSLTAELFLDKTGPLVMADRILALIDGGSDE